MSEWKSDRCPCGGVILADTEGWPIPTCHECYPKELDELREKLKTAKDALEKVASGVNCSACSCDCHITARKALAETEGKP